MKLLIARKYLYYSFGLHCFVTLALLLCDTKSKHVSTFVVFGQKRDPNMLVEFVPPHKPPKRLPIVPPKKSEPKQPEKKTVKQEVKQQVKKTEPKKQAKPEPKKKETKPPATTVKKPEVKQEKSKAEQQKKQPEKTKKAEPKKVEKPKEETAIKKEPVIEKKVEEQMPEKMSVQSTAQTPENMYHACVQQEVSRLWRPPVGFDKSVKCSGFFSIGTDGKVREFKLISSSGVLIYDLSVTKVAKKFAFNRILWGKSFTIDFAQT
ncbi:MAG: hypothetical protein H6679_00355 [Epsilonproteobacteria bacterium]|nr:hypothetical protein [Campylobacterota bacterium]